MTVAAVTRLKSTSATTVRSNTIPILLHNVTTTLVRRLVPPLIARLVHPRPSMANLATRTEIGVALHSEAPLVDRATEPSRASHSTHLDQEPRTASHLTVPTARARGPEDSTGTTVAHATLEEVQAHRAAVAVASGPSPHTIAPS